MLLGRVRIAADGIEDPPARDGLVWGSDLRRRELGGLTNLALGEVGTRLSLDGEGPEGAPAVRVENARSGGAFAAAAVGEVSALDTISFDFRAEPGVEVDLYLDPSHKGGDANTPIGPGPFRVILTGSRSAQERHPVLAGPLACADGEWRTVEIDLGRLIEAYRLSHAGAEPVHLGGAIPVFANLEEGGGEAYLPAGIGGNGLGASYWVSGFRTARPRASDRAAPRVKAVLFPGEEGTPPAALRVLFEDEGSGIDAESVALLLRRLVEGPGGLAPPEGRPQPKGGGTALPPSVAEVPTPGTEPFRPELLLEDAALLRSGHPAFAFDPARQAVEIDLARAGVVPGPRGALEAEVRSYRDLAGNRGRPLSRTWRGADDRTGPALAELAFLPRVAGEVDLDFEPGPRTDRLLRARLGPHSPVLSVDRSTSVGGAGSLRLTSAELPSWFMFHVFAGYADVARLASVSFDYRMPEEVPVNLLVQGKRKFHGVVFTDRHDPESQWSHHISYAGEFEGVRTDGLWHRAALPLARTFFRAHPGVERYEAAQVMLGDWGWRGLWPGDGYWLDNLRIEGVRPGRGLRARWRAFDLSGVAGAEWALDRSPDTTDLPQQVNVSATGVTESTEDGLQPRSSFSVTSVSSVARTFSLPGAAALPDGPAWFHLRLTDSRGNRGPVVHRRVLLDNSPPRVVSASPADGTASPARRASVRFEDYSGVDPATIELRATISPPALLRQGYEGPASSVAPQERRRTPGAAAPFPPEERVLRVDRRSCRFDRGEGVLTWSSRGAGMEALLLPGARVEIEVLAARDVCGNEIARPFRWSWVHDPSLDRTPPPPPRPRFTSGRPYEGFLEGPQFGDTNDFERELGQVRRGKGCAVELSPDAARHGEMGLRVAVTGERRGRFALRLRERYWFPDERPRFLFHYRLPREVERLALRLDLFRGRVEVPLVGPGAQVRRSATAREGAERPLAADGAWHAAVLDLGEAVSRSGAEFPTFRGRPYRLAGEIHLVGRAPPGSAIDLDDVELARRDWSGAVVEWAVPEDESGIEGFAVLWDASPDSVPPERVTHPLAAWEGERPYRLTPPGGRAGVRWLHCRARDGSGNWGAPAHLRVEFGGD
jgi:hypothetical protein